MKKILLTGLLAFAGMTAQAQAPDFDVYDLNENHHVLDDYLADGKTVLMDISATWCGPCWAFHSMHTLEKLHYAFGPEGSNQIVVLFIEGDNDTPINNLHGENGPGTPSNHPTQGDWVTNTPYPIINDDNMAGLYDIEQDGMISFPSLYKICPDGSYTQIPNAQFGNINNIINAMNSCGTTLTPIQNHAGIKTHDLRFCEAAGNTAATITNYGGNAITAAVINIKDSENNVVATQNYAGNLAMFASATIDFDGIELDPAVDYTMEITTVNGVAPASANASQAVIHAIASPETNINVVVKVTTDAYPGEIEWKIKDSNGQVVASHAYAAGPGGGGAGGPDANTTKVHNITLPASPDCYTIELIDDYGDGWGLSLGNPGFELFDHTGTVSILHLPVKNFGSLMTVESAFSTNGILDNPVFETTNFAVYPNPTTGILNFTTQEAVSVTVMDLTGKVVFTAKEVNNGGSVNLSSLQSGMYVAKIKGATTERVEKIVIK